MNNENLKKNKTLIFKEQYPICIFMARTAQYVIGAFEEETYNHRLYEKVDRLISKLDSNPKACGFMGPQKPSPVIKLLTKKGSIKYLTGFLWFKGYYTNNPHRAYQTWCREFYTARFTKEEIDEIYRVSSLPGNNNCYDEIGAAAWKMLRYR